MATTKRDNGIVINYPDTYQIEKQASVPRGRGRLPTGPIPMSDTGSETTKNSEALLEALKGQDLDLMETISMEPKFEATPETGQRKRGAPDIPSQQNIRIDIPLEEHEEVVILLEQDGVFTWSFPSTETNTVEPGPRRIRSPELSGDGRIASFEIDVYANTDATRRSGMRSVFTELVYGKVRAHVLRFSAKLISKGAVAYLEHDIQKGLVHIKSNDPSTWIPVGSDQLDLPKDRRGSILLLVHGTFSSTLGGYGALAVTEWGNEFLDNAHANYDLVLGFDHPTLSIDPLENAVEMLAALEAIDHSGQNAPIIDIVCHSRGGLVVRSLIEYQLPKSRWKPRIRTVIFVGCTNEGTLLAVPDNWHQLIDLYTNLSLAAFKVLEMIPSANVALGSRILRHGIESLGGLVKYITTNAITENAIPGLSAMEPTGDFIVDINKEQPGQPSARQTQYFVVTSNFNPTLALGQDGLGGLPKRLLFKLADGIVDQLIGEKNDLVVDVESMTAIDRQSGNYVKDSLEFKDSTEIYHTVYFTRPEIVSALSKWLGISPQMAMRSSTNRVSRPGAIVSDQLPVVVETNVLVPDMQDTISDIVASIANENPEFVVLRRRYGEKILNYAVKSKEFEPLTKSISSNAKLKEIFVKENLNEIDQSESQGSIGRMQYSPRKASGDHPEITSRIVVLDEDNVVGVVPTTEDLSSFEDLILSTKKKMSTPPRPSSTRMRGGQAPVAEQKREVPQRNKAKMESSSSPAETVWCNFAAHMNSEVQLTKKAIVKVEISRDTIESVMQGAIDKKGGEFQKESKIIIELVPRRNFRVQGDDYVEIDIPAPEEPELLFFEVSPTDLGEGEVWVIARQGLKPIVTLRLKVMIVDKMLDVPEITRAFAEVSGPPKTSFNPWMTLRIMEQSEGSKTRFRFDLEAISIGAMEFGYSDFFHSDIGGYVDKLYDEIESGWTNASNNIDTFNDVLRAIGASMFEELFPKKMRSLLWENRDKIKNIVIQSTEPHVPWELVHLREPDKRGMPDELLFLGQKGLVRWLYGVGVPPEILTIRAEKAFVVAPDYPHKNFKLPAAQAEKQFLEAKFDMMAWPYDSMPLLQKFEIPGACDLFHFAGHGQADREDIDRAKIMMMGKIENGEYLPDYLAATTIEKFANLTDDENIKPMVMLNACQVGRQAHRLTEIGGFASAFLKAGAGIFISTLWSVGDYAAQAFTEELYLQLQNGKNLADASHLARESARNAGDASWIAYTVYGNPDGLVKWE